MPEYAEGQQVEAMYWEGTIYWLPATVKLVTWQTFRVQFDDWKRCGDYWFERKFHELRPLEDAAGATP